MDLKKYISSRIVGVAYLDFQKDFDKLSHNK